MHSVSKQFGKMQVIKEVELKIHDGEFAVFVGPSGCGKSTLLRLIAGLEDVNQGNIHFDQQDVTDIEPAQRGVAMVFQSYALYPHMNVFDNMAFGLKLAKTDQHSVQDRVTDTARILQIDHLLKRKPRELSGGQRQRVAIGRAIVRNPKVFLFDEPLSNLDAALRVQMRIELKRLHRKLGTTMIYVTHDQVEAMTLADRIVVLNGGNVEQIGAPLELYHRPRNLFVAGFIGSPKMNFLKGAIISVDHDKALMDLGLSKPITAKVSSASTLEPGQPITLGLRPEHLSITASDLPPIEGQIEGEIIAAEHLGSESFIHVDNNQLNGDRSEPLVCKAPTDIAYSVGQRVMVTVSPLNCYLFDDNGEAFPRPDPQSESDK